jgi:hypothetical protein
MKTNIENGTRRSFVQTCLGSCRKVLAQINKTKEAIADEFRGRLDERLLHLALNEAEALAWQTGYPGLLFPALATEKAQGVAQWNQHQKAVRKTMAMSWFAA